MKTMTKILISVIVGGFCFVVSSVHDERMASQYRVTTIKEAVAGTEAPIQLSAYECGYRCMDCTKRCKYDDTNCNATCYDISAACCEANGGKAAYKSCGCFVK